MTLIAYAAPTLLVVALGLSIIAVTTPATPRPVAEWLGLGGFLGLLGAGLILYGMDIAGIDIGGAGAASAAIALTALLFAGAWRRGWRSAIWRPAPRTQAASLPRWALLLLVLLVAKGVYVGVEAFTELRRTDDAFTWSLSLCRHIYTEGNLAGYAMKWGYPRLTGTIMAWFTLFARPFDEFSPNFFHFNLYVFYLLLLYALLASVARQELALCTVYAIGSLPLVLTHSVMAGYSDLFLGALVSLCLLLCYRALRRSDVTDLGAAGVFCLVLPLVKLEGTAPYLPICALALAVTALRVKKRVSVVQIWVGTALFLALGAAVLATLFVVCGEDAPSFINPRLYWRIYPANHLMEVLPHLARHLFYGFNNWLLLGPLAVAAILMLGMSRARGPEFVLVLSCLLLLAGFVYVSCFGPAYEFIVKATLTNRLLLQQMPSFIVVAALLVGHGAGARTSAHPAPDR